MTDYIKREDAENKLAKIVTGDNFKEVEEDTRKSVAKHFFADIPSADVVEVVRCKDCEHRRESMSRGTEMSRRLALNYCPKVLAYVPGNHYCSYGERKEHE